MNAGSTPRRELRLALVCYGGVSLCVYMHGTTKELHRLVKASRLLAVAGDSPDGGAASPSERVYYDLLDAAAGPDGVRIEVVVDIIAGTSAGGINGVFLAKSLAHNVPQDVLRELWFDKAEIKEMLRGPTWLPLLAKAPFLLARGAQTPPLRGDMSLWLYDALQGMDAGGQSPPELRTLMPDGHGLQLFVTMTDFYGYDRQISIADPKLAHDRRHRHVFEFRYGDDDDTLGQNHNFALAFAARATSCFPGAFPPVSVASFRAALPGVEGDLGAFFRLYEISGADVNRTYFVDGGVLDNRPFRHVIEAIRQKRADVEVDRKLLYLEPDPGTTATMTEPFGGAPKTIAAVLGASSGIPRREPILDELLEVAMLNERVQRMRDVVDMSFDRIAEQVDEILKKVLDSGTAPPRDAVAAWQRQLTEAARDDAGTAYVTYVRSKIGSAVDRLATTACNVCRYPTDANHAFLVRSVYRSWAEQAGLFDAGAKPSDAQIAFLRAFDLDYGLRRLQFVIAGVNAWYADVGKPGTPSRAELDAVKTRLWQAVVQLREAMSGKRFTPKLTAGLTDCFPEKDVADFLEREGFEPLKYVQLRRAELDALRDDLSTYLEGELKEFSPSLYRDMERLTAGWDGRARKKILVRFLGFPFWDILLFPLQSVAQAGERDAVDVIRMSPLDSTLLHVPGGRMKLDGTGMGHFRAFFKRRYRENDYLWGRLDGAERLIGIVLGRDHPDFRTWCGRAFLAVLDEEESALALVEPLVRRLRHEAEALASVSVGEEPTAS